MQIVGYSCCGLICAHTLPSEAELLRLQGDGDFLHELNMDEVVQKIEVPGGN